MLYVGKPFDSFDNYRLKILLVCLKKKRLRVLVTDALMYCPLKLIE